MAMHRTMISLTSLLALLVGMAAPIMAVPTGVSNCTGGACVHREEERPVGETLLVQLHGSSTAKEKRTRRSAGITSDCAQKLNHWSRRNAACLVVDSKGKALLVYVPYGSRGWDFPGGMKESNEYACQTAERETCEETGYKVRAVAKLSYNVFKCEILAKNACKKPVAEGFLKKRWVAKAEVNSVNYRSGTWGDKRGLLQQHLKGSSTPPAPRPSPGPGGADEAKLDACGCKACWSQGFSSRARTCAAGSMSDKREACGCLQRSGQGSDGSDACGCRPCRGEGWSSTRNRCSSRSETSAGEACKCAR